MGLRDRDGAGRLVGHPGLHHHDRGGIVENAIRHGIAPRSGPGHVHVIARRDDDRLSMEVHDDGVGLSEDTFVAMQKGIGVSNTRARLVHQYGSRHRFEFSRRPARLVVRVVIPWRTVRPAVDDALRTGT